jgi:hypothetical protein
MNYLKYFFYRIFQSLESSSSDSNQSKFEAISFCGGALNLFEQSQLSYDELIENPDVLLTTPPESIVVKIDGKLVPWNAALPQLMSTTFFKRPLPSRVYEKLIEHNLKKEDEVASVLHSSSMSDKELGSRKMYSSWFPWRRSGQASQDQSNIIDPLNASPESKGQESPTSKSKSSPAKTIPAGNNGNNQQIQSLTSSSDESEGTGGQQDSSNKTSRTRNNNNNGSAAVPISIQDLSIMSEKFKKTLRLTSEQIVRSQK